MSSKAKESDPHNFRVDALHFMTQLERRSSSSVPKNLIELAEDMPDQDIVLLYNNRSRTSAKKLDKKNKMSDSKSKNAATFAKEVVKQIEKLVVEIAKSFASDDEGSSRAIRILKEEIEGIVYSLLSSVYEELVGYFKTVKDILTNLGQAIRSTCLYLSTQDLEANINRGYPRETVKCVRGQIKRAAFSGLGKALYDALQTGLDITLGVVGAVLKAVKGVFSFFIRTFMYLRDVYHVDKYLDEAKKLWNQGLHKKSHSKFEHVFVGWYTQVVTKAPILACYVMNGYGGTIYAFLALTTESGRLKSKKELERPVQQYEDLRAEARSLARRHRVKLRSDDEFVKNNIKRLLSG